jgi:hypothetical protein
MLHLLVRRSYRFLCKRLCHAAKLLLMMIQALEADMELEAAIHGGPLGSPYLLAQLF